MRCSGAAYWKLANRVEGPVSTIVATSSSVKRAILSAKFTPEKEKVQLPAAKASTVCSSCLAIVSGFAAGMAGMLYAGRLHSGRFQFGEGDELSVIAAAVLGGTSLFGGRGTVVGARSSVFSDLPGMMICTGSPAHPVRSRLPSV